MKTYKVKSEMTSTMIEDLHKMYAMGYSMESILVKRLSIMMSRGNKIQKIIQKISNKNS